MGIKIIKTRHRKYDAEFKKEVLRMIGSGRSVPDVAQSLGIGKNLVYSWINKEKNSGAKGKDGTPVLFDEEKMSLQKRIRELEMERDILKKALGIFSRQI